MFFPIGLDRRFARRAPGAAMLLIVLCSRSSAVIERAIQLVNHKAGLLRRFAPRNDGVRYTGMTSNAPTRPSLRAQRSNPALNDKLIASQGRARRVAARR